MAKDETSGGGDERVISSVESERPEDLGPPDVASTIEGDLPTASSTEARTEEASTDGADDATDGDGGDPGGGGDAAEPDAEQAEAAGPRTIEPVDRDAHDEGLVTVEWQGGFRFSGTVLGYPRASFSILTGEKMILPKSAGEKMCRSHPALVMVGPVEQEG